MPPSRRHLQVDPPSVGGRPGPGGAAGPGGPLAHRRQPVPAARAGEDRGLRRADVIFDGDQDAVLLVGHGDGGGGAGRVASDVGQRLLGAAEQRQAGFGGQGPARPVDPQGGVGPGVTAEILDQCRQLVHGGQPVAAQGADGLPRISQAGLGQLGRALDRGAQSLADGFPVGELAGALKLDGQAGQRVREHVVQLPRDTAPLGQRGRRGFALTRVLELGQQQLGAVLALPSAPDELAGHREQQAQQRCGDGLLDGRMRGQADGHGERGGDRRGDGRGRDGRQPDRRDPDPHARGYLDRPVRLQDGQSHPAAADQPAHRGLCRHAAASPAHADRGQDRRGVYR